MTNDTQTDETDAEADALDLGAFETYIYRGETGVEIQIRHPDLAYDLSVKTGAEWRCDPTCGQFDVLLLKDEEIIDWTLLEDAAAEAGE